jgi:hypothetical protein
MLPSDSLPAPIVLSAAQARVLGALVEKEVTTPEYYPLSLNALINACNQRSNREPVMNLDEEAVRMALHRLDDLKLAGRARSSDGRVAKYEHWLGEAFNFSRAETALICVLLLRGPQTPGELRSRTERMHTFEELTDVIAGLQKLMERTPPLAAVLPRQPGTKESRYMHLLSGDVDSLPAAFSADPLFARHEARREAVAFTEQDPAQNAVHEDRITRLEATVAELRQEVAALRQKIDDLFGDG